MAAARSLATGAARWNIRVGKTNVLPPFKRHPSHFKLPCSLPCRPLPMASCHRRHQAANILFGVPTAFLARSFVGASKGFRRAWNVVRFGRLPCARRSRLMPSRMFRGRPAFNECQTLSPATQKVAPKVQPQHDGLATVNRDRQAVQRHLTRFQLTFYVFREHLGLAAYPLHAEPIHLQIALTQRSESYFIPIQNGTGQLNAQLITPIECA